MDFRRKPNRMPHYDYAANGIYFVTICTENQSCRLGTVRDTDLMQGAYVEYSQTGDLVNAAIVRLPQVFSGVMLHNFTIMPNHIHLLVELRDTTVTLSHMVNYLKGYVTRRSQEKVWQKSFYDHVVRNEKDYRIIWQYIDNNPGKWLEDRYYTM